MCSTHCARCSELSTWWPWIPLDMRHWLWVSMLQHSTDTLPDFYFFIYYFHICSLWPCSVSWNVIIQMLSHTFEIQVAHIWIICPHCFDLWDSTIYFFTWYFDTKVDWEINLKLVSQNWLCNHFDLVNPYF